MLSQQEAIECAEIITISGVGAACRIIRESRNLPQGTDIARDLLQQAVGASLWLMPEAEIARRLREYVNAS